MSIPSLLSVQRQTLGPPAVVSHPPVPPACHALLSFNTALTDWQVTNCHCNRGGVPTIDSVNEDNGNLTYGVALVLRPDDHLHLRVGSERGDARAKVKGDIISYHKAIISYHISGQEEGQDPQG